MHARTPTVRVDLWRVDLRQGDAASLATLLDADETDRARSYRSVDAARRFIVAHAALRGVLGAMAGVPPAALRFRRAFGGKPRLDGMPGIEFSLSHSADRAVIGVAAEPLGVDVEQVRAEIWSDELAAFVAPHDWRHMSAEDLTAAWVEREARGKVAGAGLLAEDGPDGVHSLVVPIGDGYVAAVAAARQPLRLIWW